MFLTGVAILPTMDDPNIQLRHVQPEDLAVFFLQQVDPVANTMAAFTAEDPTDRVAFAAHWELVLADEKITIKTIVTDRLVAGHIACFERLDLPEVSYWFCRAY